MLYDPFAAARHTTVIAVVQNPQTTSVASVLLALTDLYAYTMATNVSNSGVSYTANQVSALNGAFTF